MTAHMILRLQAPMMSFGGEAIDNLGVTERFPGASLITGLLGNSLGWDRTESSLLQRLQERLVFAVRIDRDPDRSVPATDFQTAAINNTEKAWTTNGKPEGRTGSTYRNHLRYREHFIDLRATVALRLLDEEEAPNLEDLAMALRKPARPLYIGRKHCLPSIRLFDGFSHGDTALAALLAKPIATIRNRYAHDVSVQWRQDEGVPDITPDNSYLVTDQRDWRSRLHGGATLVHEASISRHRFPIEETDRNPHLREDLE